MIDLPLSPLNAILDHDAAREAGWALPDLARAALAGGARFLQVRAKSLAGGAYLAACDEVVALARPYGALVVVNDRADLALMSGAGGVHLGQDDLLPADARALLGDRAVVGLSTHSLDQARRALALPIDYLAVGPVFGTTTKETGYGAVGLELIRAVGALVERAPHAGRPPVPIVAIGGITLDRARRAIEAGAASVAVISDLLATGSPGERVRHYLDELSSARPNRQA